MQILRHFLWTLLILFAAAVAFAFSGVYDISAGSGHSAPVAWYLETLRERSIESRAEDLVIPADLGDASRVQAGAGHYADGCALCHGSPLEESSQAFDPAPPALAEHPVDAAEAFWVVKNGIKMSAMPGHGDHSDEDLWNIVAFVRTLSGLSPDEYRQLTAGAEHGQHEHDHSGSGHGQNP